MIDLIDRFARTVMGGLILVGCLVWVLIDELVDTLFYDRSVPVTVVQINKVDWSMQGYALEDQAVTVEVEYRNGSPLRLVELEADVGLVDCLAVAGGRCRPVYRETRSISLDTSPRMRGRFQFTFVVPRMATPQGDLRLSIRPLEATGQDDLLPNQL